MEINFQAALAELRAAGGAGRDFAFRIANGIRPGERRLLNRFLPEIGRRNYVAKNGLMIIRPTMAGLVPMDSPYPPTGAAQVETFIQNIAKIAAETKFQEATLRELQSFMDEIQLSGGDVPAAAVRIVLNFVQTQLVQPHLDSAEYMRGKVLSTGKLQWTFNNVTLDIDYGVPGGNIFPLRTDVANTAYFDTGTLWWQDVTAARALLYNQVIAAIASPATIASIIYNAANNIEIVAGDEFGSVDIVRLVDRGGNTVRSSDARERLRLISYAAQGEILNPATPGQTTKVNFFPDGVVTFIGAPVQEGLQIGGLGSVGTVDIPENALPLGYTHIGPTVEGGGAVGRWARVFTPEGYPYQIVGQSVTNLLPILEAPSKIVILRTELP
jgi:hypothetical protein